MAKISLKTGTIDTGYRFTWEFSNYTDALSTYSEQFVRSFEYAGLATLLSLLIGYPLAYAIAFRGGKWRNALLLAVILPFFVTYLIRTLSWQTILDDGGLIVARSRVPHSCPQEATAAAPPRRPRWWRASPTTSCRS